MGVLGIVLVGEIIRFFRAVFRAVKLCHQAADRRQGLGGQTGRVRSHVRNEAGIIFADTDAFVQLLRHQHGAARREVQAMGRLLLEGARRERRRRTAGHVLFRGVQHRVGCPLQGFLNGDGLFGVAQDQFLAILLGNFRLEERRFLLLAELDLERPIFFRHKGLDFLVPVSDNLDRYRLDTPRRKPLADLTPQERAQLVAHQPVDNAPRLLGIDHIHVDGTGMFQGFLDRPGRNFMKSDTARLLFVDAENMGQMPTDGFPFPVRVRCQIDFVGLLGRCLQFPD